MATPTKFNSVVTNPGGTGSNITPTLSTHAAGDVIEIFVSKTGNAAWSAPAGWTARHQTISPGTASTATVGTLLYRRVLSGDSLPLPSPVCNLGATVTRHAIARTIRGADVEGVYTLPEWGATGSASGTNNPIRPPSVTTPAPEMFVTHYYCQRVATNAPEPTGYTQDREVITSGTLVTNVSEKNVADQQTTLSNQDVSPTSGGRWVGMISCVPSPDYSYYRSGSQALTASGTSATPTLPTGTSSSDNRGNKDLIVATVECAGTPTVAPNTPADWTEITDWSNTTSGNGTTVRKYQTLYDGSLDRQFNRSTTGEIFVYFSVYRNAHQVVPVGTAAVQQNASSTSGTWPAMARNANKATVQLTCVADATPTYTTPATWTERNDSQGVVCADQVFNDSATVASGSFTLNSASPTLCGLVAVHSVASQITTISVPATVNLTLASFAPVIAVTANVQVVPITASLVTAAFAPVLTMAGDLVDDFNDNSRDTSKWTLGSIAFENASVGVAETNQQVEISPLANTTPPAIYGYKSVNNWDFTGRQAVIRLAVAPDSNTEAWLVVALDADNYLRTWVAGGVLNTRSRVGAANSNTDHGTFNFATQAYWRIRHDTGPNEIVWETSGDGSDWTELRRLAPAFSITSVNFYLSGGTGSSVASPALIQFDDFNHSTPSAAQVVTPTTATLLLTTFAPAAIQQLRFTPATVGLSLTSFAPVLATRITPDTSSLSLTGFAPAVTVSDNVNVIVGAAALSLTSFAVSLEDRVTTGTQTLTLTTFAPALRETVIPATSSLSLNTFAPTVATPAVVIPATSSLTITGLAPTLRESTTPSAVSLALSTLAPLVRQDVTPTTQTLSLETFAPTVAIGVLVIPATATLSTVGFASTLREAITPGTNSLSLSASAPLVTVGGDVAVGPITASLSLATQTVILGLTITPAVNAISVETFAPQLQEVLTPAPAALITTTFASGLRESLIPDSATLGLNTFAPSLSGAPIIMPPSLSLMLTAYAPEYAILRIIRQPTRVRLVGDGRLLATINNGTLEAVVATGETNTSIVS